MSSKSNINVDNRDQNEINNNKFCSGAMAINNRDSVVSLHQLTKMFL